MPTTPSSILALDIGEVRIGLAIAHSDTRFPLPLTTLANDPLFSGKLQEIIARESVTRLVLGLPRGLDGQSTRQTGYVRDFAADLGRTIKLPVTFQDEALTSHKAEQELRARNKAYTKEDVDALSATYILEDYLQGGSA
jgi:putative Holliday junction resolvase